MRIAFDAKRAFMNFTGLGNYSRFVIDSMRAHYPEHEYLLYTPKAKRNPDTLRFFEDTHLIIQEPQGIYKKPVLSSIWRSGLLAKIAKADGASILHGLSNELPALRANGLKQVVTIHDLLFIRYPQFFGKIDAAIYRKKFRSACERADRIVAVSKQTQSDIVEFFGIAPEKVSVIYQGCHPQFAQMATAEMREAVRSKYGLPQEFLLFVGTLEERKNALLILKALVQGKLDIPVVLVGKPTAYAKHLMEYIEKHNLQNRVQILSSVTFSHLPALYQMAKVFVYPSVFEGFGIPLVEALQSGVPAIGATGSCLEEAGGAGSLYTHPHNADELASHINRIIDHPEVAYEMVIKGRQHITQFSSEKIATSLNNLYHSIG
ncbi:glycosyltransferase family 4 protein [Shiella aurantiaca]|nr:glycosyltransferase family 1 protein [Shiella aurantiaca]